MRAAWGSSRRYNVEVYIARWTGKNKDVLIEGKATFWSSEDDLDEDKVRDSVSDIDWDIDDEIDDIDACSCLLEDDEITDVEYFPGDY